VTDCNAVVKKPLRILHVLSGLGQGGIEKWLVNLTAEFHRQYGGEVQSEFMTLLNSGGYYESMLERMGCRVHHCQLAWRNLPDFIRRLAVQLRQGRYDVVHCHADYLSGLVLPVARAIGVRGRIGHVHTTKFAFQARRPLVRHLAGRVLRRMDLWSGGWCIGTSSAAIEAYLGALQNQIRHRVCPCGIPCREYRVVVNTPKSTIRESLNWPQDAKVLLHVGRHTEQKNLFFLLNIFAEVLSREKNMLCVLAGSGPLTSALQARAEALGMAESVRFLGIRDDVPLLMRAADLFILPSLWEGFGLVVVEAQAVGLRSLVADVLPPEVQLVDGLVHRVSLQEPPAVWVDRALQLLREPLTDANLCLGAAEASPFSITNSAKTLMELYKESQA